MNTTGQAWRPDFPHAGLCVCGASAARPSLKAIRLWVAVHLAQAGTGGDHAVDVWTAGPASDPGREAAE